MKCGNCHRNNTPASDAAVRFNGAPVAVQPIRMGIAPATAPTVVLSGVRDLSGVYTTTYRIQLASPSSAVSELTFSASQATPTMSAIALRPTASALDTRPAGSG